MTVQCPGLPIKDDSPVASINIEESRVDNTSSKGKTSTKLTDACEYLRCHPVKYSFICVCKVNIKIVGSGETFF